MRINYFNKPTTKRFADAFHTFEVFENEWGKSLFYEEGLLTEEDLKFIYRHLMARYYRSHFRYVDDLGISLNVFRIISEYYPNTKIRLNIVKDLREMELEEFKKSGMQVSSSGANPKVRTEMDKLIDLVDSQQANFVVKSEEQSLRAKFNSLYDGVMEDFILRFNELFVVLYGGMYNYVYSNKFDDELFDEEEEE